MMNGMMDGHGLPPRSSPLRLRLAHLLLPAVAFLTPLLTTAAPILASAASASSTSTSGRPGFGGAGGRAAGAPAAAFLPPASSTPAVGGWARTARRDGINDLGRHPPRPAHGTVLGMGLLDGLLGGRTTGNDETVDVPTGDATEIAVGEVVGSGSYGTVHLCTLSGGKKTMIAKRAWTVDELEEMTREAMKVKEEEADEGQDEAKEEEEEEEDPLDPTKLRQRAERCRHYLEVESHCLAKIRDLYASSSEEGRELGGGTDPASAPNLVGTYPDSRGRDWLVFDLVERSVAESTGGDRGGGDGDEATVPALTLAEILEEDWSDQHVQDEADPESHHHLYVLQRELNLPTDSTFDQTLDVTLTELLRTVWTTNSADVVHRDVKPLNLLVDGTRRSFTLIDYGSAADLTPRGGVGAALGGNGRRVGLEDGDVVALSPIYAAPETYVRWDRAPLNFDSFSAALVFMQMMFNLLDERTDAAFRQQLEDVDFDLDGWMRREAASKFRPDGIEDAVAYLGGRPGLWSLLRDMVRPNPERRASSEEAYARFAKILSSVQDGTAASVEEADGPFFAGVVSSLDACLVPESMPLLQEVAREEVPVPDEMAGAALIVPRPLHFVATFDRAESLGLLLSEVDVDDEDDDDDEEEGMGAEARAAWERATASANPGEVYVRGIVDGGQAESIGIFEIGDRLTGVGEFPFIDGGFGEVVEMLKRQPPSSKSVTLHFDRKSVGRSHAYEKTAPHLAKVVGQGAWSSVGRRKAQEDRYILHEIHDDVGNAALLTGVFDGHGGNSASTTLSQLLPSLFSAELASYTSANSDGKATSDDLKEALLSAYEITCNTYRNGCDEEGECVADYDPREGIIIAGTGAKDLVAGSTVTTAVMSVSEDGADYLTVLNCGDSRTLVVGRPRGAPPEGKLQHGSVVHFSTRDHAPNDELEMERLLLGKSKGFSQPKCSMSRWRLKVGDYQYALSRSLEGSFATSKGIVSDPDVSEVDLSAMLSERELGAVIFASDGLFEVVDNEEAGKEVLKMREAGLTADEAAKNLCRLALGKGTSDNVSVVVIYLD